MDNANTKYREMTEKQCLKKENSFKEKAKEVHKGKYDYSESHYVRMKEKVKIICPIHGEFWQSPQVHLKGHGCPHCNGGVSYDKEKFVQKSREVHGDFYNYDKVVYEKSTNHVIITCPKHGDFSQRPDAHIRGLGCPICNATSKMTTERFVMKLKDIFGNKYDLSNVVYRGPYENVKAICPIHGEFEKRACSFLRGHGCQQCGYGTRSKQEDEVYDYLREIIDKKYRIFRNTKKYLYHNGKLTNFEIDIFIPSLRLGVEVNGEYWHRKREKANPGYHKRKNQLFKENSIKLVNVSYREWTKNKEKQKKMLSEKIFNLNSNIR